MQLGKLDETGSQPASAVGNSPLDKLHNQDALIYEILADQARLAVDPEAGSKGTSAARVVMQIMNRMGESSKHQPVDLPIFVLGRDLAVDLLAFLEASVKKEIE